jgi:hypothetical protein
LLFENKAILKITKSKTDHYGSSKQTGAGHSANGTQKGSVGHQGCQSQA